MKLTPKISFRLNKISLRLLIGLSLLLVSWFYPSRVSSQTQPSTLSLISWNIQNMGGTKDDAEILKIAQVLRNYDVVAIQEVTAKDPKGAQAVARLAATLNRMGAKWDYAVSMPTQSASAYQSERYAYLWKTSKVTSVGRPFLDSKLAAYCTREPYLGKFREKATNRVFYVVNFHSKKHSDHPETEIPYFLNYTQRLQTENVIIAGDFNLNEKHAVWKPFYAKGYEAALHNAPTTLQKTCKEGKYTYHAIDNFYCSKGISIGTSKPLDIVGDCSNLAITRLLSDHLPILLNFSLK